MARLFDAAAFALELKAALDARLGLTQRDAAIQAGVSMATFSRAINADPNISHENVLRLTRWMDQGEQERVAA